MTRKYHLPYSAEFKEQALSKARQRGTRTLEAVANELSMSLGTLKRWLKVPGKKKGSTQAMEPLPLDGSASVWTPDQRLQALLESFALSGPALHAWCREKGLFAHQLTQWRESFCSRAGGASPESLDSRESRESKTALRDLQGKYEVLQRDLRRKERALAEAAALLVLQKKFRALLGEDEDR
jgi:transposase-like protein